MTKTGFEFRILVIVICPSTHSTTLRAGLAQAGESFDLAQDREPVERPVERPVEPFGICNLLFGIFGHSNTQKHSTVFSGKAIRL